MDYRMMNTINNYYESYCFSLVQEISDILGETPKSNVTNMSMESQLRIHETNPWEF